MEIVIKGLDVAIKHFRQLPHEVKAAMQIALARSLRDIQRTAQHEHRFTSRTGNLERSITTEMFSDTVSGRVYLDDTVAVYGPAIHHGIKPRTIYPRNRSVLRWPVPGGFAFAKYVNFPGTEPDEFLYNAARSNESHIRQMYAEALAKAVKK